MNKCTIKFKSKMENESFARICTCSFLAPLNPTVDELMEIKTIVSEAVTNAIIHGYDSNPNKIVKLEIAYDVNRCITLIITDKGNGIENVEMAMEPLYTTKLQDERSGMGMTIMQTFSDSFDVITQVKEGTSVVIQKQLQNTQ